MRFLLILCFIPAFKGPVTSARPVYCTAEDRAIFDRYVRAMASRKGLSTGELIVETARFFIGTPYVASTLEKEPEGLVINLREMDCTTLVENAIALAYTMQAPNPSFDTFCLWLRRLRYRDGMGSYTDRLHYFSDWIYENERRGRVRDMTKALGGKSHGVSVFFMSSHPERYPSLRLHPEQIRIIRAKEREISGRKTCFMIPKTAINGSGEGIKNGDVVCFVTNLKGLDISHVGIICRQGGRLHFIHASSTAKKVIVESKPLQTYAERIRTTIGILIVRPLK